MRDSVKNLLLKILKIGIHSCSHIFRFNGPSLHNICMRDINLVD